MKTVNRGYFLVKASIPMIEWSEKIEGIFPLDSQSEPSVYLIEDDFIDEEPILKANFKKIFLNELNAVTNDDSLYPEIKWELFVEWFDIVTGTAVFDLKNADLKCD